MGEPLNMSSFDLRLSSKSFHWNCSWLSWSRSIVPARRWCQQRAEAVREPEPFCPSSNGLSCWNLPHDTGPSTWAGTPAQKPVVKRMSLALLRLWWLGVETPACGTRGVHQGGAVQHTLCTCCYQVGRRPLLWKQLSLCLCSVRDVMVPPTVLESAGYQYYWLCRAVADRACSVIGVQGRWISSSISSELRIVSGPHAAVDASVAAYLPPKVLSMTGYYCSVPVSTVIVFRVPSLPLQHSVSIGSIILLVKVPVNCCCRA